MEYIFVIAAAITAIISIWKNYKKGTILASVIKGIEDSAHYVPTKDLQKIKRVITQKADQYGVGKALSKIVKLLTEEK